MIGRRFPWHLKSRKITKDVSFACPYSTLLPQALGDRLKPCCARHGNLTPPRISPSCPHENGEQEYHYRLTGSLRNSLSCCFVDGWVPLAALHWPSFMRKPHRRVLAHPPASLCACWRSVRERISVAGCDRAGPVFFKVKTERGKPSHCVGSERAFFMLLFQKFFYATNFS